MATYFDFEHKKPHINIDDIYVKNGNIKDDKLVLEYSVSNLDPLSISLSALDKMTYIDNANFINNKLILKYNRPTLADLSIELSSLDKHVNGTLMSDDKNTLSLCFNDGNAISIDTTKFAENFYLSSQSVNGKNLILKYNTLELDPIVIDLEQIATKILDLKTIGNTLSVVDAFGQGISVDLTKFAYNDFIDNYDLDAQNQLILKYSTDKASGKANDLSIDLSRLARNYYIKQAKLCEDKLVFDYNTSDAGQNLSIDIAPINNYIASATIIDKTLVLSYNSDRFAPLSINVANFIKDYYIKDVKLSDDNKLYFEHNNDEIKIVPVDLTKFDTYIDTITLCDDILTFDYSTSEPKSKTISLTSYINNDVVSANIVDNKLRISLTKGQIIETSLSTFDKYISNANVIGDKMVFDYNTTNTAALSVDVSTLTKDTYINEAKFEDNKLKLKYNDSTKTDIEVNLSALDDHINGITQDLIGNTISFNRTNGTPFSAINLTKYANALCAFHLHPTDGNYLMLEFENGLTSHVSLDKFDKFINTYDTDENNLSLIYNNNKGCLVLNKKDIANNLSNVYIDNNNKLCITFTNNSTPLTVDLTKYDKRITNGSVAENNIELSYNDGSAPISIDVSTLSTYVDSAVIEGSNLCLTYNANHAPTTVSLSKFDNELTAAQFINNSNILRLTFANGKSTDITLDKFDKPITDVYIDNDNHLVLRRKDSTDIKTSLSQFDKYIATVSVDNTAKEIQYFYNKDLDHPAFHVDLDRINYSLKSGTVNNENKLVLSFDNNKDDVVIDTSKLNLLTSGYVDDENNIVLQINGNSNISVDASKLKTPDTYISSITLQDNDSLVFDYNNATPRAQSVNLHKFARNDYIADGTYDNATSKLVLKYNDQSGFETKLPALSIDLPRGGSGDGNDYINSGAFDIDNKKLVLNYNTTTKPSIQIDYNILSNMHFVASDEKSILSMAQAIEQIVTAFGGNRTE